LWVHAAEVVAPHKHPSLRCCICLPIHLELMSDISSSTFIGSLNRFVPCRDLCVHILMALKQNYDDGYKNKLENGTTHVLSISRPFQIKFEMLFDIRNHMVFVGILEF
jgi:hypothetical protein